MTKRIIAGAVMFLTLHFVGGVASVQAQQSFILNFDENGNGSININGAGFVPLQGILAPDPTQTGSPLALMYLLPPQVTPVVNGDVQIFEPNSNSNIESDRLRFTNGLGVVFAPSGPSADRMYYYSDLEASGNQDLADTGLPSLPANTTDSAVEVGPEGANGFTYTAAGPNTYNGISDTPEASSFLLLGTGLLSIAGYMRRRWLQ